jgi:hypothetical protein
MAPAPGPPPARSANRTLLIVLAVVTAGALVVCCGGSAGAFLYFRTQPERSVADGPAPTATPPRTDRPVEPSPSATAPPPPLEKDHTLQGRGSKVVRVPHLSAPIHMLSATHSGSGGFAVTALDAGGQTVGLLGNGYGRYRGTLMLDGDDEAPPALKVRATGAWKLVIRDARRAPLWRGAASGTTSTVLQVGPESVPPLTPIRYDHKGRSNFVVRSYGGGSWDLLVNDIGKVSGETTVPAGTRFIEIVADGAWSFRR